MSDKRFQDNPLQSAFSSIPVPFGIVVVRLKPDCIPAVSDRGRVISSSEREPLFHSGGSDGCPLNTTLFLDRKTDVTGSICSKVNLHQSNAGTKGVATCPCGEIQVAMYHNCALFLNVGRRTSVNMKHSTYSLHRYQGVARFTTYVRARAISQDLVRSPAQCLFVGPTTMDSVCL